MSVEPTQSPSGSRSVESPDNPLSLQRLKAAFARMMAPAGEPETGDAIAGKIGAAAADTGVPSGAPNDGPNDGPNGAVYDRPDHPFEDQRDDQHDEAVSLHAILEGVLFVAGDGGRPRSAEELAAALRDVSPDEVDQAIDRLNDHYARDAAPFHIESSPAGYRLRLDEDLGRLREKFHGRVREAKLTPAALEVLSVVAYRQPTTAAMIDKLRGSRSNALLANLVRRRLVRVERGDDKTTRYHTTDRFLKLFGLSDLDQLPRAAELE